MLGSDAAILSTEKEEGQEERKEAGAGAGPAAAASIISTNSPSQVLHQSAWHLLYDVLLVAISEVSFLLFSPMSVEL